ncbi:MAG: Hpt domain-containing protein [Lachnospiraceae bacterium]|nr:Hpt domain-containing protein [Lachnospiraceae bacterium]
MDLRIDINAGIENCGGMKDFYVEILDSFVEEGKKEAIIKEYADKDLEMYAIDVHSLKGTLRLIGAMAAGDVAEKLQFAAEAKDMATIDSLHDTLVEMIDASLTEIRAQL